MHNRYNILIIVYVDSNDDAFSKGFLTQENENNFLLYI